MHKLETLVLIHLLDSSAEPTPSSRSRSVGKAAIVLPAHPPSFGMVVIGAHSALQCVSTPKEAKVNLS